VAQPIARVEHRQHHAHQLKLGLSTAFTLRIVESKELKPSSA